ncbi:unnamed protein product [Enterobius vermicularis]|uniref:SRCR domain-containing protein n=1 Tax=Enterobius vermicularis TaxID=51028 RepID=A0A0N4V956_ENTVE|nr:unnamed protein product [Enterobius vermicularis]
MNDPNGFPHSINCSKPEQLNMVLCENWNSAETFDTNLHNIFFPNMLKSS